MGRKRIINKKVGLKLSVDKDIVEKLNKWKINKSAMFTEKAKEMLEFLENRKK